jgi:hypothetical protein
LPVAFLVGAAIALAGALGTAVLPRMARERASAADQGREATESARGSAPPS